MDPLTELLIDGKLIGSAFAGGVVSNLFSNAVWEHQDITAKLRDLFSPKSLNQQNHSLLRAIVRAQSIAAIECVDDTLWAHYRVQPGSDSFKDRVMAAFATQATRSALADDMASLRALRSQLQQTIKDSANFTVAQLDTTSAAAASETRRLTSNRPAAAEVQRLACTAMRGIIEPQHPALPGVFWSKFDAQWFGLFRLAVREEVKKDPMAKAAFDLDAFDSLALQIESAQRNITDELRSQRQVIERQEALLTNLRTGLRRLHELIERPSATAAEWTAEEKAWHQAQHDETRDVVREDGAETRTLIHELRSDIAASKPAPTTPPPFQLPPSAAAYFGRAALIADLTARLRKDKHIEVWGSLGMGKTALAAEALADIVGTDETHLAASPFPQGIVLLDLYAHFKGSLDRAWGVLAEAFDDTLPTEMPARDRAAKACAHRRALIILEGAEELGDQLTKFTQVIAPETTLLVLTRDGSQTAAARRIRLDDARDILSQPDALGLLRHLTAEASVPEPILSEVQALLGGHPLALTWTGSQLADASQPAAHFLRDLRAEPFTKLSEPGGKPEHTLKWMFDRSVRLMEGTPAATVLAAVARVAEPFMVEVAAIAGGQEFDLQRLVQLALLRVSGDGWQFAHAMAGQYARALPLPDEVLIKLGQWAISGIAKADARCLVEGTAPLGQAIAHATALLAADGAQRLLRPVVDALINHDRDYGAVGIRRGRLDFARRATESFRLWLNQAPAADKDTAAWHRDISVSLDRLGDLAVAQGDLAGALLCFSESKTIFERLADSDPANAEWQRDLSVSLNRLGDLAVAQGDLAGALRCFSESKTIAERLVAGDSANAGRQRDLSVLLNKLGNLAVAQGDLAAALRCFTESQTIFECLAASDPSNTAWQRDLSVSLQKLGDLALAQGDLAGALRCFSESQTIAERLADSDPANAVWQRDLSVSLIKLGDLAVAQGDVAGAMRCFAESKTIREHLAASDPANAKWQRDLFVSHWKLMGHAKAMNDDDLAESHLRQGYAVLQGMVQKGMHLDGPVAAVYEHLQGALG